jgi:hypothetical protein
MKFFGITTAAALLSTASAFSPAFVTRSTTALHGRKPLISGNWKLNPQSKDEAIQLATDIAASITEKSPEADVALFVPYVFIEAAMGVVDGKINVGAEVRFQQASKKRSMRVVRACVAQATPCHQSTRHPY